MADFSEIGPEAFSDAEGLVISYKGSNFYKACDALVTETDMGASHCVKRVGHPGPIHEDYDGVQKADSKSDLELSDRSLEEAVYIAIGAATVCWDRVDRAGVFHSEHAKNIGEQLLERIRQAGPIYG